MYMFIAYSTVLVHCNRVVCLHFIFQCIMYYNIIIKNIFHHSLWELLCGLKIPATAFNKAQLLLPLFTFIIVFCYLLLLFVIVICYCYCYAKQCGVTTACSKTSACLYIATTR